MSPAPFHVFPRSEGLGVPFLSDMARPAEENAAEYSQFKNGGDASAAENNIIAAKQSLLLRLT